jgi:hypothetical protein
MAVWHPKLARIKNNRARNMLSDTPKTMVNITEIKVSHTKKGLYLPVVSEIAPKISPEIATERLEIEKDTL